MLVLLVYFLICEFDVLDVQVVVDHEVYGLEELWVLELLYPAFHEVF